MTTPVIMDIAAAAVLVLFVLVGMYQGFIRSLAGLVIIVVSLVGAAMISATFADPAAKMLAPIVEEHISERVHQAIRDYTGLLDTERNSPELEEFMEVLGIDADAWEAIASRAEESMAQTGATVAYAVVESLTRSVIYGALFLVSFLILLLLLHILAKAMDLLVRLPGLHALNVLGGALAGLVKGALVIFLAVWVLRRMGVSFETDYISQTRILQFFAHNTPLSVLTLLQ